MKTSLMTMTAAVMLAASGQTYAGVQTDKPFIGKQEITIKDGRLTPEALWAMGRPMENGLSTPYHITA